MSVQKERHFRFGQQGQSLDALRAKQAYIVLRELPAAKRAMRGASTLVARAGGKRAHPIHPQIRP